MRQFHQINCECLGAVEPHADAEVIIMLMQFLTRLGIKDLSVSLNSLGCKECRPAYHQALRAFLQTLDKERLCADCLRRMDTNPLRVLDCKVPDCQALLAGAPQVIDYNCEACRAHIAVVERLKERSGWLSLQQMHIESFDSEEYLLFSGMDDAGNNIDQETCEKLFNCSGQARADHARDHVRCAAGGVRHDDADGAARIAVLRPCARNGSRREGGQGVASIHLHRHSPNLTVVVSMMVLRKVRTFIGGFRYVFPVPPRIRLCRSAGGDPLRG